MSNIISQNITKPISLPTPSTDRERLIISAYRNNEPDWLNSSNGIKKLDNDLLCQIMIVENISTSKMSIIDKIDFSIDPKFRRVDTLKNSNNNLIVTQINDEDDNSNKYNNTQDRNSTVFRLTLQSKSGAIFFAINAISLPWENLSLGSKIILNKGTLYLNNCFLIKSNQNFNFIGGLIKDWNENKNEKLREYINQKLLRDSNQSIGSKRKRTSSQILNDP